MRFWIYIIAIGLTLLPAHARAEMEDYPSVKLQGLDKSTARTTTFEAKVGSTITYGPLFIRIQSCRKAPPIETPESAAFLQIWEVPPETGKSEWVFSGWMFASSPALSAMDHPVDCLGREEPNEEAKKSETDVTVESQDDLAAPTAQEGAATADPASTEATPQEQEIIDSEGEAEPDASESETTPSINPDQDAASPTPEEGEGAGSDTAPATENAPIDYDAPYSPSRDYPANPQ